MMASDRWRESSGYIVSLVENVFEMLISDAFAAGLHRNARAYDPIRRP